MIDNLSKAAHSFRYAYVATAFRSWDVATESCELVY